MARGAARRTWPTAPTWSGCVAFARYSRDKSFTALNENKTFLVAMAAGSVVGTIAGGALLGVVPTTVLVPLLALLLLLSARKVWRHG